MPAHHAIDNDRKVITTNWTSEANDSELVAALRQYLENIRTLPEYHAYDEIVDFSGASSFNLSADGLARLAQIAAGSDIHGARTRLAIVVTKPLAYGLGRMYEIYRSMIPRVNKEVRVFKDRVKAYDWIVGSRS